MRSRFDAVAHDAIMAVSDAFGGQRGRVGGCCVLVGVHGYA